MYASGFGLLIAQYVWADLYGVILTSPVTGQVICSPIITKASCPISFFINGTQLNTIQNNVTSTTRTSVVSNINSFLGMVWELIQLLTGTYIFNILGSLGVPGIVIEALLAIYFFLLIRAFFGYIRGITKDQLYAKLFQHNPYQRIVLCVGHSMKNILGIALIKYHKTNSYQVNDVISFVGHNNVKYCHRIIFINNCVFIAKGDNLDKPQNYEIDVPLHNIEGKVFWSIPEWNDSNT